MDWKPIETAPKDGVNIVLLVGEGIPGVPYILVGSFCEPGATQEFGYPEYSGVGGWIIFSECAEDYELIPPDKPTHWLPIPDHTTDSIAVEQERL